MKVMTVVRCLFLPPDIDECDRFPEICEQNCANTNGSYSCSCWSGFYLDEDDGRSCIGKVAV